MGTSNIEKAYAAGREIYAKFGVDTDRALDILESLSLSLHCWQGDDVGGFEKPSAALSGGGIQVTGRFPGKPRTIAELRTDLKQAFSLIPGRHRLNLHAIYGEFGGKSVGRDEIEPDHFRGWVEWAKQENLKLDFNATLFSHPLAESGFTLSSKEKDVRMFWIEHVRRCRKISAFMGGELKAFAIHNIWIPDGSKDIPFDRWTRRRLLKESLDEIFETEYDPSQMKDALESKLFGIGSEAFVVGSHEFYMGYALKKGKMVCLDLGHFHPTESIADKVSAILHFSDELLLHVSRPVRWDSDHVVILNDDTRSLAEEVVRGRALGRVHIALDYFDGSMNRVGALALGARSTLKAFLVALLEPEASLRKAEDSEDHFGRLALLEELKTLPFGAVWNYYCLKMSVPPGAEWLNAVGAYEKNVLSRR